MSKPQVLVIGTGGVGTVVAYELSLVALAEVSIVVRGDYAKVINDGYELHGKVHGDVYGWKPDHIYRSVEEAGACTQYDYVVVSTKNVPDVTRVEDLIAPVVTESKTTVIMMQNGFDLGRPIIKQYPNNVCLSAVSHIGSHNNNGIITQDWKDKCVISYFINDNLDLQLQEKLCKDFIHLLAHPKNEIIFFPDAKWYRYRKLVNNATLNTVAAITRLDNGRLFEFGVMESVCIPAMREVLKIARADGVELPKDIINTVVHADDGIWFKPSMLVDVEKANPIELEVILGNLLAVGKELSVETPILSLLYQLLRGVQLGLKEQSGYITLPEKRPENSGYFE